MVAKVVWGGSLHQTFRLLPDASEHLRVFLEADGMTPDDVLDRLPYEAARAATPGTRPDPKRYRDGKQVYQTVGLLYQDDDGRVHVTDLGVTVLRWLSLLNDKNAVILARHAAYALAACQLQNPTGQGQGYAPEVVVHPFAFIWRAMLRLDGRISTDELNRAIFRVKNEDDLEAAIETIESSRMAGNPSVMGAETITGVGRNDRVISWMALASFGWTLITDKRTTGDSYYRIPPATARLVADAAQIRHTHRVFSTTREYVEYVSGSASLPRDVR